MKQLSRGLIAGVLVIALADLCGWTWDLAMLRQFGPGLPAMNPMTAVTFLLSSLSFFLLSASGRPRIWDTVGRSLAILVLIIAVIRLTGYFVALPAQVDHWLWPDLASAAGGGEFPGRMAFSSAVGFICWSIALLQIRATGRRRQSIQPLALVMFALGLLSLIGYGYQVEEIHGILRYLPMAVNTAVCFLTAAAALLLASANSGIMKELAGQGVGSIMARRLIPFGFAAPIVLGWLRLLGARNGAFTVEFGASALVLSIITCFMAVIMYNARLLNRREAAQKKAFNEELSKQVEEKTAEVRGIFERVTDAFMAYDEKGDIVYMNTRAREIMSKVGIGMPGKNIFQSFPVAAISTFGEHFRQAMETQEDQHFEMCSQVLDLWLECHLYPSRNGISEFFRDITEEKKIRRQLAESNAELRALTSYLQNVREEERTAIAREVHDELGQQLTALNMNVGWLDDRLKQEDLPDLRERMGETVKLLDQAIFTVQKIAADLRPGLLDDLGLVEAVEWQAGEFEKRYGILTKFEDALPEMEYSSAISTGLFRICQEALTNVARHSEASHVTIYLGLDDEQVVLRVEDDGKGMAAPANERKVASNREDGRKKLGLLGMKERALMMGGTLELESTTGEGVSLTVRVPMPFESVEDGEASNPTID